MLVMTVSASHPWIRVGVHDGVDRGSVSVGRGSTGASLYSSCVDSDRGMAGSMSNGFIPGDAVLLVV
jgi:hypothetical protein